MITRLQEAQSRRNAASKEIGKAKAAKDEAAASKLMTEVAELKDGHSGRRGGGAATRAEAARGARGHPQPAARRRARRQGREGQQGPRVGTPPKFSFPPKQHFEIGEALGLMDFEAAAKISGARFVVLKGALSRLERAIAAFMLDPHTGENGYTEYIPPSGARCGGYGTANLPKFEKIYLQSLES